MPPKGGGVKFSNVSYHAKVEGAQEPKADSAGAYFRFP